VPQLRPPASGSCFARADRRILASRPGVGLLVGGTRSGGNPYVGSSVRSYHRELPDRSERRGRRLADRGFSTAEGSGPRWRFRTAAARRSTSRSCSRSIFTYGCSTSCPVEPVASSGSPSALQVSRIASRRATASAYSLSASEKSPLTKTARSNFRVSRWRSAAAQKSSSDFLRGAGRVLRG